MNLLDVIEHPSPAIREHRLEQLDRDRLRLLAQLEAELLMPTSDEIRAPRPWHIISTHEDEIDAGREYYRTGASRLRLVS